MNILNYINNTSTFILHKDSKIRQYLLMILTAQEDIVEESKSEKNPSNYKVEYLSRVRTSVSLK